MIQDWVAKATSTDKGQKLFQSCDYSLYKRMKIEYENLSISEKTKYKGADEYIKKNGGPELNSLNKNYMLLVEEIDAQIHSERILEMFPIETIDHDIKYMICFYH